MLRKEEKSWMYSLLIFTSALTLAEGVKFPYQNGIEVDGGELKVGQYSTLSCNFIKWKQETISKVIWSLGYTQKPGVITNFFESNFETGEKEVPSSSYFSVDPNRSGEKEVSLMLNDDREGTVNICCMVVAIRDSGYGMLKKNEKEKCVPVSVVAVSRPNPRINFQVRQEAVRVGDSLYYECEVENGGTGAELAILLNDYEIDRSRRFERNVRANITIQDHHFRQGRDYMNVACRVLIDGQQIDIVERRVNRDDTAVYTTRRPFINQQPRKARFYSDPQFHGNHGKVPCHSYIILEDGSSQGQRTAIIGDVPLNIMEYIPNVSTAGNRHYTDEEAIQILNILGYNGYRVVGMGTNANKLTWTLEREYFEFHQNDH